MKLDARNAELGKPKLGEVSRNAELGIAGGKIKKVRLEKFENKLDENGNLILDEKGEPVKEAEPFEVWEGSDESNMKRIK